MSLSKISVSGGNVVYKNANDVSVTIPLTEKRYHKVDGGILTLCMTSQIIVEPLYNLLIGTNATPITNFKTALDALDTLLYVDVPVYDDNAAALLGGLTAGMQYRTVDTLKIVH